LRRIFWAFLFLVLAASAALATVMVPLSLKELTDDADAVVLGHCTGRRVFQSGGMIYTEYTIQVYDSLKGAPAKEMKVVQPGGEYGGKGIYVSGVARFSLLEEVMLFLGKDKQGARDIVGWSQGKFRIYYDEQSKKKFAAQEFGGAGFIKKSSGETTEAKPEKMELEMLKAAVKDIVAAKKAGRK